ncbi:hypothetical protein Tsubulata_033892 [Turnera subulata]|uniref:N-acetyltransferase domain-containing protein n=1 Tax=Turnera subulata TaxID=218843 RepID=A0A9Q0FFQ2_9ROSI|nr:hypothetical protein Tsubulata_033892 [Turnera subulata]
MGYGELKIRSYNAQIHRAGVEDLERRCEVGPAERVVLFTDTLGDPICRIRNSPMYKMLVAELRGELVGVIQGSIKIATVHKRTKDLAKLGYVLGLRIAPLYRRRGIGMKLVRELEEWFIANDVDYAYMATEKDNEASVNLFVKKLGYVEFRTPAILVRPVNFRTLRVSSKIEMAKLKTEDAEYLYRRFMSTSAEFFPDDIGNILRNKLSLGTWVAYSRGEPWKELISEGRVPNSWAMLSVWNSGELFKVRLEKAPLPCLIYAKMSRLIDKIFPCFQLPAIPDFFQPFGFYFIYGVYHEGPLSGKLVRSLCQFVHNMATKTKDCKAIVTEVGGDDTLRLHIPHWDSLSCPEDLWCIKSLKSEENTGSYELPKTPPPPASLFVDPREV